MKLTTENRAPHLEKLHDSLEFHSLQIIQLEKINRTLLISGVDDKKTVAEIERQLTSHRTSVSTLIPLIRSIEAL